VVGKKGTWLKLQLKNGRTGWIYHSLAKPERELLDKPQTVLRGSKVTTRTFFCKNKCDAKLEVCRRDDLLNAEWQ
jgi:SH3-like domain-containing protein